jgi:hypothetical protein
MYRMPCKGGQRTARELATGSFSRYRAGMTGMVKVTEPLVNIVNIDEPKKLKRLRPKRQCTRISPLETWDTRTNGARWKGGT